MRRVKLVSSGFVLLVAAFWAVGQDSKDTPKAAETRRKLQQNVTVEFADAPLSEAIEDLKSQVKGLGIRIDSKGGVSANIKIGFKAQNKPLKEVLEGMFKKNGLGYVVISKQGDAYDGTILIKQGNERGFPSGEEPDNATKSKTKPDGNKIAGKDKSAGKPKTESKDKPAGKDKPEDTGDKTEQDAARKLGFAKTLANDGKTAKARERLEEIVAKYPKTKAAEEARELLKNLKK